MTRVLLLSVVLATGCYDQFRNADDPDWTGWDAAATTQRVPVRVATWNVQSLGEPASTGYEAVASVLRRLDADIVGLQEIDDVDVAALYTLADELGYNVVVPPPRQPYGTLGNGILARFDAVDSSTPSAADLSGDLRADDMTRLPVVFTTKVPGTDVELTVVTQHWKSGFEEEDAFRRAVDGWRTAQAADRGADSDILLVMGDTNAEDGEDHAGPDVWTAAPPLSVNLSLGDDLVALLAGEGLPNDPYVPLRARGLEPVDLAQRDGTLGTRPSSGRRIDRIFAGDAARAAGLRGEVYDTRDDTADQPGLADGLPKPGVNDTSRASDHLPVLIELRLAAE
ncbi:MAG: endonuclease/exonuclease/phosphatase family protein [Alphaproteobacteria bacterium]|nr:endonuclease/exonuclease/phosphatase family protein [Alphaproteobacteria bacterium]